jgi:hypothetical protein
VIYIYVMASKKLVPSICEICGNNNSKILHKHHIVERTDPNTSNHEMNLAIICPTCHSRVHAKQLMIIGIFPSTKPPYGRTVIYEEDGNSNLPGVKEPYYKSSATSMKVYYERDFKEKKANNV